MRILLILAGLSVVAIAGGVQLRATLRASDERAATAAEWSSDDAQFVAVGLTSNTLVTAMPDQQDIVGCDALIDSVVIDSKIVVEIQTAGFDFVQCGSRREKL